MDFYDRKTIYCVQHTLTNMNKNELNRFHGGRLVLQRPYLDGLQGAAEQHVVGGDQRAHGVVMGTDGVYLLQSLNVPHL